MTGLGTVLLLSGPNLNLLGSREPDMYGTTTLEDHIRAASRVLQGAGYVVEHLQSNGEQPLVEAVHGAGGRCQAIVINAGALSHYGWSLHDALAAFDGVVVEVHISNTARRESWRHGSVVSPVADASLLGLGAHAYELAAEAAVRLLTDRQRPRNTTA
jgi:3-dehydroquinate dehydratase-2